MGVFVNFKHMVEVLDKQKQAHEQLVDDVGYDRGDLYLAIEMREEALRSMHDISNEIMSTLDRLLIVEADGELDREYLEKVVKSIRVNLLLS